MITLLIIEDDAPIRELIGDFLTLHDYRILEAGDGRQGLALAQQERPDLIICDIMMPYLNGFEVLDHLQQNPQTATIPFIFLTAKGEIQDMRQGMNLGADDYLIKPFNNNELLKTIEKRLEKRSVIHEQYQQKIQEIKEELEYLLTHDSLTELPNQLSLRYIFNQKIEDWESQQKLPIVSLSLERCHWVNQTFGYEKGDQLIRLAVERIINAIDGHATLIRMNGVQFSLIFNPISEIDRVTNLCKKILDQFSNPFPDFLHEIFLGITLGITLYPQDGQTLEILIRKADQVRRWIKERGGNQFQFYQNIFPNDLKIDYLELESELRRALQYKELAVYYQPQVDLKTYQIVGAEALLRWQHSTKGFISPNLFIPLAEKIGLIELIGQWVLETACEDNYNWQQKNLKKIRIAVNLSGRQFNHPKITNILKNILESGRIKGDYLELEITESVLVQDINLAIEKLNEIQSLGVTIAIDDFGTGYSSLSYLQQFPFNIVKIDQCFIRHIERNPKNAAITETLIDMAHKLNLKVIAEGVETKEELACLQKYNCDEVQGYLFSRPIPANLFEDLLRFGLKTSGKIS